MQKSDIIYIIKDGQAVETTCNDLIEEYSAICKDETVSPDGVEPRLHIREETEVWSWGSTGQNPELVEECETEDEAEEYLWKCWVNFLNTKDKAPNYWVKLEDCETAIAAI